ncbi:MAG: methylated-DNA--[protein]-cysteine S-methyltransferase [Gemmatimonadetes bacterium]|nr:MAG: methylated-DNA--[protein]-cysteine S-methyltransferase [Gemmatimonadota bacterium]
MASPFYAQVYALVRQIPPGKVMTYGQIAWLLDKPQGARAVGWALHQLTPEMDVPWQRVINAQGKCSTFLQLSSDYTQQERLEREGVLFDEKGVTDLQQYQWHPPNALIDAILNNV